MNSKFFFFRPRDSSSLFFSTRAFVKLFLSSGILTTLMWILEIYLPVQVLIKRRKRGSSVVVAPVSSENRESGWPTLSRQPVIQISLAVSPSCLPFLSNSWFSFSSSVSTAHYHHYSFILLCFFLFSSIYTSSYNHQHYHQVAG